MLKICSTIIALTFLMLSGILFAQSPQAFRYQAIARNSAGAVIQNQQVGFKISLLLGTSNGTVVYSEEHTATSNQFGLVNLEIGNGSNPSASFSSVDWSTGPYFIKIEMDISGGTNYADMGVTQLLSVPYALFAASGNTGPQGLQGEQGLAGQDGQQGSAGLDGIGIQSSYILNDSLYVVLSNAQTLNAGHVTGAQGSQGIQGLQGVAGADGETIINSFVLNDSLYIALSGGSTLNAGHVRGAQGIQGLQGTAGQNGQDGANGISLTWLGQFTDAPATPNLNDAYYNLTDKKSYIFNGSTWDILAQDGTQGVQGAQGIQGEQGIQGSIGTDGISINWMGTFGSEPLNPNPNDAYYNSVDKKSYIWNGVIWQVLAQDGLQGIQGPQGLAGTGLTNRGNWINGTVYNPSDYVFDRSTNDPMVNSMWICQTSSAFTSNTNPYLDATNWVEFQAPTGQDGINGTSINWMGALSSEPSSPTLNQAYYNTVLKKSFIYDGILWQILAQDGENGTQGIAGTNGINGVDGTNGISIFWFGTLSLAPNSPSLNEAYYNSTDKKAYIYDGTTWQILAQDGINGTNGVSVNWLGTFSNEPATPNINDAYYNSSDKKSYLWDGNLWHIFAQDGIQGLQGDQGPQGQTGEQGSQGIPGIQGEQGLSGINGNNGISIYWLGTFGSEPETPSLNNAYYNSVDKKSYLWNGTSWQVLAQDGLQGIQGPQGEAGTGLTNRGNWATGTEYNPSDYVFDRSTNDPLVNSMWISQNASTFVSNTQPYLDATNWIEFQAPAGQNGQDGISINWLGALATAPTSPSTNQAYYNTALK
ncbi:MAG TPA: hypothetical protein DEH02_05805, partial [Bacteroidales bacterium]|nr:hypothetical protein [Bacteroidales bacterium]